jgi:type I restriction enzyme S subunit
MKEAKDMKEGWEYKKLGEVCDVIENISWSDVDDNTTYQYIDLSAVNRNTYSIDDTTTISKSDAPSRAKQIVKHKDILFGTTRPLLKRVCVVPVENDNNICSTGFCVLRPKNNMILSKWVFYQLLSEKYYNFIEPLQSGANYPAVSDRIVKSYIIPLPSLSEQQQIVSELDLLSGVIEKQKAQLEELDKLAQSIFYDMFGDPVTNEKGWELRKLKELGQLGRGVSKHRPRNAPELLGGSMPLIQTGDVSNSGMYITAYSSTYSEIGVAQSKVWLAGTLCITIAANIGNCAILTFDACFPDSVVGFIANEKVALKEYVYYIFERMQSILEANAPAVAQKNINLKILDELLILLPPLSLQQEFAAKVEAIEAMKAKVRQSLKEAETLFNSRMDYYFN